MGKKTGNKTVLWGLLGTTLVTAGAALLAESVAAKPSQTTGFSDRSSEETLVAESRDHHYRRDREVRPLPTIPQAFNRAFYSHTGNFFDNRGIWQQFRLIFGVPNFVDNSISQDGRAVNRLYRDVLEQQTSSGPVLRTPDLPNPYTGSILTTPLVITEEPVPAPPPFPSFGRPPVAPPPADSPRTETEAAPRREGPVPALW
ncbi:MAG: hypothetical protein EDM05_035855 [Leptolyngbya sp. IPPAS B-1204]|nr:hypothetical protein [Elainella sp. C42_A2020_010]RNJ67912.1 MAG: hypothetical protein EDM05_18295 [Leptolyngbya sp. IPPAS B-1204]